MTPEEYAQHSVQGIEIALNEMDADGVETASLWLPDPDKPRDWLWTEEADEGVPQYAVPVFNWEDPTDILATYLDEYETHLARNQQTAEAQIQEVISRAAAGDTDAQAWLNTLMLS